MARLNRRQVLGAGARAGLLGVLSACGIASRADKSPQSLPLVGYLGVGVPTDPKYAADAEVFRKGLSDEGLREAETVVVDWRWGEGRSHDWVRAHISGLVARNARVIVPSGSYWKPARETTSTVPIVMVGGNADEVIARGWATSVAKPGGSITGLSHSPREASRKRGETLIAVVPGLRRVALLTNLAQVARPEADLRATAEQFGLDVLLLDIRSEADLGPAFERLTAWNAQAIWEEGLIPTTVLVAPVARLALERRLPTIHSGRGVEWGGLMFYGAVTAPGYGYRRAASMVAQILSGVNVGAIPMEIDDHVRMAVNRRTLAVLGLTLPPHIAAQVTDWFD